MSKQTVDKDKTTSWCIDCVLIHSCTVKDKAHVPYCASYKEQGYYE